MFEKDDVAYAIDYVRKNFGVGKVAIWGRSMGAVTAFFTMADDPTIAGAVCDSPFASLKQLIGELASTYRAPGFVTSMAVSYMGRKIKSLAGFNIKDLNPIKAAAMCFTPLLLLHGANDKFIQPQHSQQIFAAYQGDEKELFLIPGADHNSERPHEVQVQAIMFLARVLDVGIAIDDIGMLVGSAKFHFAGVQDTINFSEFSEEELVQMRHLADEHS
jgi:pimeloyl-ACP methyl ester carboxylesterase